MANRIPSRVSVFERRFAVESTPHVTRTILVVDDDEGIRRFVERVLESAGYATVAVANGPEALRAAAAIPALDMVVTDVMMPDMSGCELVRHLRRVNPDMKALYVTGYRDQLFGEKVMLWENEAFIDKPCSTQALLDAVSLLWCARIDGSPRLSSSIELAPEDLQPASPLLSAIVCPQPMGQAETSCRNRRRFD